MSFYYIRIGDKTKMIILYVIVGISITAISGFFLGLVFQNQFDIFEN
jgi:hypothetical protein